MRCDECGLSNLDASWVCDDWCYSKQHYIATNTGLTRTDFICFNHLLTHPLVHYSGRTTTSTGAVVFLKAGDQPTPSSIRAKTLGAPAAWPTSCPAYRMVWFGVRSYSSLRFLLGIAYLAVLCLCNLSTLYLIIDASYSYVTTSALRPLCTIYVHRPSYYLCQSYSLARVILFNLNGTYPYSHAFSQSGGPSSQDSEWGRGIAGLRGVYPCHRQHVRQRIRRLVSQDRIDRDMQEQNFLLCILITIIHIIDEPVDVAG